MRYAKVSLAVLTVLGAMAMCPEAFADCSSRAGSSDVKTCLAQDLRDSDKRINSAYQKLMASRDEASKSDLRNEQRAWLKDRDAKCHLDNKEADREKWLQAILADDAKTLCVVRYTFARVGALNDKMAGAQNATPLPDAPRAPKAAPDVATDAPVSTKFTDGGYQIVSLDKHQKGKWYYEVTFNVGRIAPMGDFLFEIGYDSDEGHGVLKQIPVRHSWVTEPSLVIGFAIDLDSGGSYARVNGKWNEAPGSNAGIPTKLGTPYHTWLAGSSPLGQLLKAGLIKVNLGDHPFAYALPDGYRPFSAR